MKTFLRLGGGLLRGLWAALLAVAAVFAWFLETFAPAREGEDSNKWSHASDGDRALLEMGYIQEHERDELGLPRYPEPGDPDY